MILQPTWLVVLSWVVLIVGLASTVVIVVDHLVLRYHQPAKVMEVVWPASALYFGPAAVLAYRQWGRPQSPRWLRRHRTPPRRPPHAGTIIETLHCATHCLIGAIVGTLFVFSLSLEILEKRLWPEFIADYVFAVLTGIAFRYFTEAGAGGRRARAAIRRFFRGDLLSVSVFEFALLGWLAVMEFVVFHETLQPSSPVFWFIVQLGLIIGFFAAWPPTLWLVRSGAKAEPGTPQQVVVRRRP
ncbi:DUF4396 domain-containing protein [Micromonospora krabiensis]|uniref:DUF4396 domain-containing protein n=1 Tax=Micromonospora krabiensis TaxID=307121 RepID=A0A1C3MWY9_9ACTN|nr:DUF4396 domain-containing protein [Micromonospora krabiensis]SBV24837.1 protein of unknown function [Micromonospora krabiensis]